MAASRVNGCGAGAYIPPTQDPALAEIRSMLLLHEEHIYDDTFEDETSDLFNQINRYLKTLGFKPTDKEYRLKFNFSDEENYQNLILTLTIQNIPDLLKSRMRMINYQPFEFDYRLDALALSVQSSLKDLFSILKNDPISFADLKKCFEGLDKNITDYEKFYCAETFRYLKTGRALYFKTHDLESKIDKNPLEKPEAERNFLNQLDELYALNQKDPIGSKLQQIKENQSPGSQAHDYLMTRIESAYKTLRKTIAQTCAEEHPCFYYINENEALCNALDELENRIKDYQYFQQCYIDDQNLIDIFLKRFQFIVQKREIKQESLYEPEIMFKLFQYFIVEELINSEIILLLVPESPLFQSFQEIKKTEEALKKEGLKEDELLAFYNSSDLSDPKFSILMNQIIKTSGIVPTNLREFYSILLSLLCNT